MSRKNTEKVGTMLKKDKAALIAGCAPDTLAKYRRQGLLIEGVHYIKPNPKVALYFEDTLRHWAEHRHCPGEHHQWLQERAQRSA